MTIPEGVVVVVVAAARLLLNKERGWRVSGTRTIDVDEHCDVSSPESSPKRAPRHFAFRLHEHL